MDLLPAPPVGDVPKNSAVLVAGSCIEYMDSYIDSTTLIKRENVFIGRLCYSLTLQKSEANTEKIQEQIGHFDFIFRRTRRIYYPFKTKKRGDKAALRTKFLHAVHFI